MMNPTAATDTPAVFRALDERFEHLPLDRIVPSKTNPRQHVDQAYLDRLAVSIADKGIIEPIIVRALGKKTDTFEIVAGECRYRAAKLAQLSHLPSVIRAYTDEQALEIQLIENIHRADLTPLEQARGYRALIDSNPTKHSAASIAERLGMSPAWVWDRMKLLDLVSEAKTILEQDRMSVGHAILIARLKPEDQKRVIAFDDDSSSQHRGVGLWRHDAGFDFDEDDPANKGKKPGTYDGLKPCSVRELEAWINDHIRFDVVHAAKAQPLTFESLAVKVEERRVQPGRGKKVIAITFDHFTQPEARTDEERTFGPKSFKFADGQKHTDDYPRRTYMAATCEHAVLGVVAAGDRRGESFDVCIARDKCQVHWGKEIKEREKNQKLREGGKAGQANKREASAAAREEATRKRQEAEVTRRRLRFQKLKPALRKSVEAAIGKLKTVPPAALTAALKQLRLPGASEKKLAMTLVEYAVDQAFRHAYGYFDEKELLAWAGVLRVDVKALEAEVLQPSGDDAKKKAAKRKKAA